MSLDVIKTLEQLGIDEKQASVYLACLELGSATVQELAEKSGVKRTSIYNFLEEIKQKGLVTEVKQGNKVLLIPEDPNILLQRAQEQTQKISELLPDLMAIFNRPGNKPKVHYYQGVDGLMRAYEEMLNSKENIVGFSDYEKMFEALPHDFLNGFPARRKAYHMSFSSVTKDGPWGRQVKEWDKDQMRETRLAKDIEFDTEVNIYGNKVMLLSFRRPYAGVIIEDYAIATTMRSIWKMVWASLK
jgi:sugar-specific transcriptional regulator TrmB